MQSEIFAIGNALGLRWDCFGIARDCKKNVRAFVIFLLDYGFCEQCKGFRIGDANAKRCSRRERTLKRNGAVCHVAGNCRAAAVAGLFGDNSAFVANPFAVVFKRYLLERFGESRGAFVLDAVGDGGCICFEACGYSVWACHESRDVTDCRARFFQDV